MKIGSNVGIFFFRPWLGAGSTTFTAHLFKGLKAIGKRPLIYRVVNHDEFHTHPFGEFEGVAYRNVSFATALKIVSGQPTIVSAMAKPPHLINSDVIQSLMQAGMRPIVHDANEARTYDWKKVPQPICVRQAVTKLLSGSVWLPQPYLRSGITPASAVVGAVSTARVAASKRTDLLLQANRLLAEADRVKLLGAEDGLYAKQLATQYADVYSRGGNGLKFPLNFTAAVEKCAGAAFNLDMSKIDGDGGGTQYCQLEAMDAGCVNVMHADWFAQTGDVIPGTHAVTVDSPQAIADLIKSQTVDRAAINAACQALLAQHDATVVAKSLLNILSGATVNRS